MGERIEVEDLRQEWWILTPKIGRRWSWEIPYPISRYKIASFKTFASKAAAGRDAWRVVKLLVAKPNPQKRRHANASERRLRPCTC